MLVYFSSLNASDLKKNGSDIKMVSFAPSFLSRSDYKLLSEQEGVGSDLSSYLETYKLTTYKGVHIN